MVFLSSTLLHLVSIISSSTHVPANGIILFLFMAEYYSIVYIYHFFLILSSVDGHLGGFCVLAIVNNATMNVEVHVSFSRKVLSPAVGLLDHMVVLFLVF